MITPDTIKRFANCIRLRPEFLASDAFDPADDDEEEQALAAIIDRMSPNEQRRLSVTVAACLLDPRAPWR